MKSFAQLDIDNNGQYLDLLTATAKLSRLFSESEIPYIYYRAAENIFCRSFEAGNLSRSDTAFDATLNNIGIGLKTFVAPTENKVEKIAEFNTLAKNLRGLQGRELVTQLSIFRNERIEMAKRLYGIDHSVYHIVARRANKLLLFETDYDLVNINDINNVRQKDSSIQFDDGKNFYLFNFSKSTLFRRFSIPIDSFILPIEIIEDPYKLLLELFDYKKKFKPATDLLQKGVNYIILPLYGIKNNQKFVFEKSGLNQWNAGGRKRDLSEIYIPVPIEIHHKHPNFFPDRDKEFKLKIPTGETFKAKICQDNSKALMTNPNRALSDWLLRNVFQLKEGELATYEKLNLLGFDSVIIRKDNEGNFSIDKSGLNSYEDFIQ